MSSLVYEITWDGSLAICKFDIAHKDLKDHAA
jgi:hypothetical protein